MCLACQLVRSWPAVRAINATVKLHPIKIIQQLSNANCIKLPINVLAPFASRFGPALILGLIGRWRPLVQAPKCDKLNAKTSKGKQDVPCAAAAAAAATAVCVIYKPYY